MAISDLARIQGLSLSPGRASPRVLNAVKQKAHAHVQQMKSLTTKSSVTTSNYTKGFAKKAYTIQLSPQDMAYGPTYAKPR